MRHTECPAASTRARLHNGHTKMIFAAALMSNRVPNVGDLLKDLIVLLEALTIVHLVYAQ